MNRKIMAGIMILGLLGMAGCGKTEQSVSDTEPEDLYSVVAAGEETASANNENNETVDYYYEFGIVKDEDIVRPDTTDYMEVDM